MKGKYQNACLLALVVCSSSRLSGTVTEEILQVRHCLEMLI